MITYPVDVANTKWAILQLSDGAIIVRDAAWPVADGSTIPGLDPNFVYLLQVKDARPSYDSRLYFLETTEVADVGANTLTTSYTAIARENSERIVAAENEEQRRLTKLLRVERELLQTRLMVGSILAYIVDSQQFPPKVQTMAANYIAKAQKVHKNRDRLKALIVEIEAGGADPDLDAGWEDGTVEAPPEL